jgi:hypothetical protein
MGDARAIPSFNHPIESGSLVMTSKPLPVAREEFAVTERRNGNERGREPRLRESITIDARQPTLARGAEGALRAPISRRRG